MRIKFYVINLKRSSERRKSVISQFKRFNITNYEFIEGLDALSFSQVQLQRFLDKKRLVRPLSPGEIGCVIGHVKAIRSFLNDSEVDYCVIMEDDFIIREDPVKVLSKINDDVLDKGPVMLYAFVNEPVTFKKVSKLSESLELYKVEEPIQVWSAMGYLLNKVTAKRHINVLYPIKDVADSWSFSKRLNGFKDLFVVYPFLIEHALFDSSRIKKKSKIVDWIVRIRLPIFYQIVKQKRERFIISNTSKINFIS